jgi:phage recombination protein Bet
MSKDVAVRANGREVASYDAEAGSITIPTQVSGVTLTFKPDQRALNEGQMVLLGPLGIEADWDPRQVAVFLMECQERGLDPWQREAYLMRYPGNKYVRHVGIDGFRKRGESTGEYRGRTTPLFCGEDGQWREVWPQRDRAPYAAKVGILRAGFDAPVYAVALYDEYVVIADEWKWDPAQQKKVKTGRRLPSGNWRTAADGGKPTVMTAKCAEAQAWRAAFPQRFGGFYAPEEFDRDRERGEDPSAAKRREAYAAAHGDTETVEAEVVVEATAEPTVGEGSRTLLMAELDEQAEVLGRTTEQLSERWSASRGGRAIADATPDELAAHVHAIRPYAIAALRDQKRDEEATQYEQAPAAGTCEVLFGRGPAVPDGPPAEAVAE